MYCIPGVFGQRCKCFSLFLFSIIVLFGAPTPIHPQAWSGVLDPTRAIDWSEAGIPGGIPNRTPNCATLNAATYGNGSSDDTSAIHSALSSCHARQGVLLSARTLLVKASMLVRAHEPLRGE